MPDPLGRMPLLAALDVGQAFPSPSQSYLPIIIEHLRLPKALLQAMRSLYAIVTALGGAAGVAK
eukprot:2274862-Pyramimonas_sp.AAC.1